MEPEQAGSPAAERARGSPVEDYALIGDTHTAALVGRNGSIDWLCLPRFDSGACFAALLGGEEHGFWRIAPVGAADRVVRRYRGETLVLETEFHAPDGVVRLVDCMSRRSDHASVVRVVEGFPAGSGCAWTWWSASITAGSCRGCRGPVTTCTVSRDLTRSAWPLRRRPGGKPPHGRRVQRGPRGAG